MHRARPTLGAGNVIPDVTAQIFWSKNRQPERWRDVQRIDASMGHYVLSEKPMTEDEWIKERGIADKTIEHDAYPVLTPKQTDDK